MSESEAQKSEVHEASEDARAGGRAPGDRQSVDATSHPDNAPEPLRRPLDPPLGGIHVIRDDTDAGGPLVIQTEDPNLNPPQVPQDPFPTDRKPEIDPPVPGKG